MARYREVCDHRHTVVVRRKVCDSAIVDVCTDCGLTVTDVVRRRAASAALHRAVADSRRATRYGGRKAYEAERARVLDAIGTLTKLGVDMQHHGA